MSLRKLIYLVILGLFAAGCTANPAVLNTHSMVAEREASLFRLLFYMGIGVFVLVAAILLTSIIRDHRRHGDNTEPKQVQGNTRLEIIWTAIPILLVLFIFIITVQTMTAVAAPPPAASDLKVTVIGHRWWWEFDYPDLGIKTANDLHIPAGVNVQIKLTSADVIHSFWVPNLSGKTDVIPGQNNTMWLKADQAGTYVGQCAEFCGLQHANMRLNVIAQSTADFDAWAAAQKQLPAAPQTALEQQGQKLVTQGICSGCHAIDGTNMKGAIGPNLTHLYSRTVFAGGVLPLTDQNLALWLKNPNDVKPGNLMANVRTSDQQIEAIIAYLKTLK